MKSIRSFSNIIRNITNKRFYLLILLSICIAFYSCDNDDDVADKNPHASARINGELITFDNFIHFNNGPRQPSSLTLTSKSHGMVVLNIYIPTIQVGTYSVGGDNIHNAYYNDPSAKIYSSRYSSSVNTIEITEFNSDGLNGKFSFEGCLDSNENCITITSGEFYKMPVN